MASAEQIKALVASHSEGDEERFYAIAMQVAASEAKRGNAKFAEDIRKIINQTRSSPINASINAAKSPTLIVRPNRDLSDLLTVSYPRIQFSDMALNSSIQLRLDRVLKEQYNWEKLKAHGLNPRRKLLFTGPPGTGKTMSASALAGELNLPLFVVRLDGLITKFMGESITKLRIIFDAIQNTRAVYLFDEFDSIGTHRGFVNDVGEIKRVLNSFLMYIEQDISNSIIIAATNHPQNLDFALFRRFDELLEFELPSTDLIVEMIKSKLESFKKKKIDYVKIAEIAEGLSFADIASACEATLKEAVINNQTHLTTDDILTPIEERVKFHSRYVTKNFNNVS